MLFRSKDGIHVNDKFAVLERKCLEKTKVPLCDFELIGNMTVSQVFETYSLVVPDENIVFKENYYFKFAKHGGKEE